MRRGFSLVEIVVALCLFSLLVLFVVSLLPSSVSSLKRADGMQAASMYGLDLLENARQSPPGTPLDVQVSTNATTLHAIRDILPLPNGMVDVRVTVTWKKDAPPLIMSTRLEATPTP